MTAVIDPENKGIRCDRQKQSDLLGMLRLVAFTRAEAQHSRGHLATEKTVPLENKNSLWIGTVLVRQKTDLLL
jgi:hypothetical protein